MARERAASALDLSDDALVLHFGQDTFHRGRAYAQQRRVGAITVGGPVGRVVLTAPVRGERTYHTVVTQTATGYSATNASYNGAIAAGGSTSWGIVVDGDSTAPTNLTCTPR